MEAIKAENQRNIIIVLLLGIISILLFGREIRERIVTIATDITRTDAGAQETNPTTPATENNTVPFPAVARG